MALWATRIGAVLFALATAAAGAAVEWSDTIGYSPLPVPPPPPIKLDRRIHAIRARFRTDAFPKVESIRFTVREGRRGSEDVRHWTWYPEPDSVFFQGKDRKGSELRGGYNRKTKWSLGPETIVRVDSTFLRDRFTLLFPHLFETESGIDMLMEEGNPGGAGEKPEPAADWIRISYPMDYGILSGETYELLADRAGAIRAWNIFGRGSKAGKRFDWSPIEDVGGLPLSLERKGPDGFAIRFTDVAVTWLRP